MSGREASERIRVAAAVTWRGPKLLLTQRPPGGPLGEMWEFPGGKLEAGESVAHALVREIAEELGVRAVPGRTLEVTRWRYPHGLEVEVHFVECALEPGEPRALAGVHALRWVEPRGVELEELLEADRGFMARLAAAPARISREE